MTVNKLLTGAVIILLLAGVGLYLFKINKQKNLSVEKIQTQETGITPQPSLTVFPKQIEINLNQLGNSGEYGKAILKEIQGKTVVKLSLQGFPPDISQPAYIHEGFCPAVGKVKYTLNSLKNGQSETTLDVTLDQVLSQLPLAINIRKSASRSDVYFACGNLLTK